MSTPRSSKAIVNLRSKIIDKIGGHIHITNIAKNQYQVEFLLNILYVVIFNVDEKNCGNKKHMDDFISKLKEKNDARSRLSFLSFLSGIIDQVQELLSKHLIDDKRATFLLPPDVLKSYDFSRPIIKLCHYYHIYGNGFLAVGFSKNKEQHNFEIVLNSIKTLLTSRPVVTKYQLLSELRQQNVNFRIENGEPFLKYGSGYDNYYYASYYLRGQLALIILPFAFIKNCFESLGFGSVSASLTGIVLEYLQEALPEKQETIEPQPFTLVKNSFFAAGFDPGIDDKIAHLVMDYCEPRYSS